MLEVAEIETEGVVVVAKLRKEPPMIQKAFMPMNVLYVLNVLAVSAAIRRALLPLVDDKLPLVYRAGGVTASSWALL